LLTNEVPDASAGTVDDRAPRRRTRRRVVIGTITAVFLAFCGLTARLFVFPVSGMPAHVDAIVMMAGPGDRFWTALRLASQHRAPVLVLSSGDRGPNGSGRTPGRPCGPPIPGVRTICFNPNPDTTQGEAEYAARLARQYHWHSVALVTITAQDSRARLRMERCFSGHVYVMTAPTPVKYWPYELAYEWAATIKALTINRSC
jgi:uncharacterized SAM-binding protein YcdF (DUF218 family)